MKIKLVFLIVFSAILVPPNAFAKINPYFADLDPSLAVFPDGMVETKIGSARRAYSSVREGMSEIFNVSVQDFMADQTYPRQVFPKDKYDQFNNTLQSLLNKYPDDSIRSYVERRIVILDWLAQKRDSREAAESLMSLADSSEDPKSQNFAKGFALTVLSRDGCLPEAAVVFKKLDADVATQLGFFGFEIVKYYAKYAEQFNPLPDDPKAGGPVKEDYDRRLEFADFIENTYLPKIAQQIKVAEKLSTREQDNIALSLSYATRAVHQVVGGRLYMDLSKRASDEIIPVLLSEWENILGVFDEEAEHLEPKGLHLKQIKNYKDSTLPRLKQLQKNRVFTRDFLSLLTVDQAGLQLLEDDSMPTQHKAKGIQANTKIPIESNMSDSAKTELPTKTDVAEKMQSQNRHLQGEQRADYKGIKNIVIWIALIAIAGLLGMIVYRVKRHK